MELMGHIQFIFEERKGERVWLEESFFDLRECDFVKKKRGEDWFKF